MPATDPLPASLISKIEARSQSVRFEAVLREIREFRSYCCNLNSNVIMGVSKQPVPIVGISPNPVCLGSSITVNTIGSYAPGSSITNRSISFGDSTTIDPAGTIETHVYATAGTFTVTVTITEGTGLTQTTQDEVNVIDCSDALLLQSIYAFTDGSGVYYFE